MDEELNLIYEDNEYIRPPKDLDIFFMSIYEYYYNKGISGLSLKILYKFTTNIIIIIITKIILFNIDWMKLSNDFEDYDLINYLKYPEGISKIFFAIYILIFSLYFIFFTYKNSKYISRCYKIRNIFKEKLNINNINNYAWTEIVEKLSKLQLKSRIILNKEDITNYDIANRIMRKENYLISMIEDNILNCNIDNIVIWNIWIILLNPMFHNYQIKITKNVFKKRCKYFMIINTFFLPMLIIFYLMYFIMNIPEIKYSKNDCRLYTLDTYWRTRKYNEYTHQINRRLHYSSKSAKVYLNYQNKHIMKLFISLIKFISGSFLGCLTLITLTQEDSLLKLHIFGQTLLWWFGLFTGIFTFISNFDIKFDNYSKKTLDDSLKDLKKHMIKYPTDWDFKHHDDISKEVSSYFPDTIYIWYQTVKNICKIPFILYDWYLRSEEIVDYINSITTYNPDIGDICSKTINILPDSSYCI